MTLFRFAAGPRRGAVTLVSSGRIEHPTQAISLQKRVDVLFVAVPITLWNVRRQQQWVKLLAMVALAGLFGSNQAAQFVVEGLSAGQKILVVVAETPIRRSAAKLLDPLIDSL